MILNLIAVAIFALNSYLRIGRTADAVLPILLSVVAVVLVVFLGWLGGEMVFTFPAWGFSSNPREIQRGTRGEVENVSAVTGDRGCKQ